MYGAYLLAIWNAEAEEFQTISKIGTGFSEERLKELTEQLNPHQIKKPHSYYRCRRCCTFQQSLLALALRQPPNTCSSALYEDLQLTLYPCSEFIPATGGQHSVFRAAVSASGCSSADADQQSPASARHSVLQHPHCWMRVGCATLLSLAHWLAVQLTAMPCCVQLGRRAGARCLV